MRIKFLHTLSGRFLILTTVFVMLAEILIFVPSVARFREDFLLSRLERAQIASLALLATEMIDTDVEQELLANAEVLNVVLRRDEARQLMLSSPFPGPVTSSFDLRDPSALILIRDAMLRIADPAPDYIRVIGEPVRDAGMLIEVTMETSDLRAAMIDYGVRILILSAVISIFTALLLFLSVRGFLVKPIKRLVAHMTSYAAAPEDHRNVIQPSAAIAELYEAEVTLQSLETQLTGALRQKERLAQLGAAVAKISHDLRNILTTSQLIADRLERSEDPSVKRAVPKLMSSMTRAVNLCESTLAFGKAEEPPPTLARVDLAALVADVIDGESLAIGDAAIDLAASIPAGLSIRCDGEQIFRVLSNLARNARQAIITSGQPGTITFEASETDEAWWITVADTGPGLPMRAQEHLFKPFQGGTRRDGTGLGLAIAAELVKGHGGMLTLQGTGPDGTIFDICLPKSDPEISV